MRPSGRSLPTPVLEPNDSENEDDIITVPKRDGKEVRICPDLDPESIQM